MWWIAGDVMAHVICTVDTMSHIRCGGLEEIW